ncbi:MAG: ATP-binding cassette domain-containing protein [Leptolyngbya sp. SIO3F4]|nr:ATP-binding cassette domain-containing protein [Leptolyngbya sp. SIO3F4]
MSNPVVIDITDGAIRQGKKDILTNVNLHVEKGQFIYMVGKTGSGKSSLMKTLYGELPLKEGKGSVAGFDLRKLKTRQIPFLRRKLGIVFQDFQLLPDRSVNQNLVFVMKATGWKDKKEMKACIEDVLKKVGLEDKGLSMPHELSGGEQQRVAIARALVNSPEIILADEPTGNLDPDTSEAILHLLSDISMQGTAILMATHDTHLMEKYKSRTIRCENGQVITE